MRPASIFFDYRGYLRFGWIVVGLVALIAACIIVICVGVKVIKESSCNTEAQQYHHVRDADYRFWNDECWLALDDGTNVPASRYRVVEGDAPRVR